MGCGDGCSEVLASPWANVLGVSVAVFGLIAYVALAAAAFFRFGSLFRWVGTLVVLAAVYFTAIQGLVIRAWCPWCCTAHAAATLSVFLLARRTLGGKPVSAMFSPAHALAAVSALSLLAAVQIRHPHHGKTITASITPGSVTSDPDIIRPHGDHVTIRESLYPVLQAVNPISPRPILILSDYDCGTCRRLKLDLKTNWIIRPEAPARLLFIPVARSENARSLLRYLHAARLHDSALYESTDHLLLTGELPTADLAVKLHLEEKLGSPDAFAKILAEHGPAADILLDAADTLFNHNAHIVPGLKGIVPLVMAGNRIFSAQMPTDEVLIEALTDSLLPALQPHATQSPPTPPAPALPQTPPPAAPSFAPYASTIQPILARQDLGACKPGDRFFTSLTLKNTSDQSLTLAAIEANELIKLPKSPAPASLAPGAELNLTIEITTPAEPGAFSLPITIRTQGNDLPQEMTFTGTNS